MFINLYDMFIHVGETLSQRNEDKEAKKYRRQMDVNEELSLEQKLKDLERQIELIRLKIDFLDSGIMSTNKRLDNLTRTIYTIYKMVKQMTASKRRREEGEEE